MNDFKDLWLQNMVTRIHGDLLLLLPSMQLSQCVKIDYSYSYNASMRHLSSFEAFKELSYVGHANVNSMKLCNYV